MSLISELKRRNVLRVGAAYIVTAWLIIQVVETIFPVYGLSDAAIRNVITGLAVAFLPALVLAWVFELTPDGLKLDSNAPQGTTAPSSSTRSFDRAIILVLTLGIIYFAADKFLLAPSKEAEVSGALAGGASSEASSRPESVQSIAVLAFADMSPDRDQAYMSDGIAEEILNLLAQVPDLRVISRTSAFAFKDSDLPIPDIAGQLGATFILEGSVRKAGNQLRITAQLIEAGTDTHRWSETYDRELSNIFDIQDEIAAHVVGELTSRLLGEVPSSTRLNEEAYTKVLQARYLWNRRAEGDEEAALALYQEAVETDPDYAPAWTGLSVAYAVAVQKGRMDKDEGYRLAREAVDKSLALDPDSAEARVRLGQALAREGDIEGMLEQYRLAFEAEPNNPLTLGITASQAGRQGDIDKLVRLYDRAAEIDPLSSIWPNNKAASLIHFRRADAAEEALKRAYALNGDLEDFRTGMIDIHNIRGEFEAALELLQKVPQKEYNLMRSAVALSGAGRVEESDRIVAEIREVPVPEARLAMAMIHANRGNNDLAFEWLAKVEGIAPWLMVYDAYLRVLVDDPRWEPWVDSLDWPWEYAY